MKRNLRSESERLMRLSSACALVLRVKKEPNNTLQFPFSAFRIYFPCIGDNIIFIPEVEKQRQSPTGLSF